MFMSQKSLVLIALLVLAGSAQAASTDVVFKGGGNFTSTTGCTGWNPDKEFFLGTYWVPVAGSTNGPDSVITFHFGNGTGEGFQRDGDVFLKAAFRRVRAVHVYTRIGTYFAYVKASQSPETILDTTETLTVTGAIKGWDQVPDCIVNFTMSLVKDLQS